MRAQPTRKIVLLAGLISATLATAACAAISPVPVPTVTVTVTASPAPAVLIYPEVAFLSSVRILYPASSSIDDASLLNSGKSVCQYFIVDRSYQDQLNGLESNGVNPALARAIISAAVAAFCPEDSLRIPEELR